MKNMDLDSSENLPDWDESGFGMSDEEMLRRMRGLVELAIARKKLLGLPIARYDAKLKRAYMEYPDGRKEYAS